MENEIGGFLSQAGNLKNQIIRPPEKNDISHQETYPPEKAKYLVPSVSSHRQIDSQESEDRFRSLANNLNVGIYRNTPGPEGRFIEANPAIVSMFGFDSKESFIRSKVVDLYQDSDDRRKFNEKMTTQGFVANEELRLRRRDGTLFIGSVSTVAVKDEHGQVMFYDGVLMDITEQKQAKSALEESESKFRSLFDLSPQAIALVHMDSSAIVDVNDKFCDLFKFQRDHVLGMSPVELGFYSRAKRQQFTSCLEKDGKLLGMEMDFRAGDGSILNTLMFSRLIQIKGENYILTIFHDMSELKRLELQLRQAQKMEAIGALAGGIAHDFNNILSAIIGYTELAMLNDGAEHCTVELKEALIAANRARDLVKQILAFSRQTEEERIPVRLGLIAKEAVKFLRATIPTTIEINTDIDETSGAVFANSVELHQIIMNLCTNALHAIGEKSGKLEIEVKNCELKRDQTLATAELGQGQYVRVSVKDSGIGMPPEIMKRIFDPYFTTKQQGVGTGLGLSVVHGIVRKSKGAVEVESMLGKGSAFHVYLPRVDQPATSQTGQPKIPRGDSERILFVDDEKMLVDIGKKALDRLGYEVVTRTSPIEALELFRVKPESFDLVISDQTMPNMTGDELARELIHIRPDIPVIICTGYSQTIDQKRAADRGIKGFVMKPMLLNEIAAAIRRALTKSNITN
jgi:PAS domain S-box-containing protein